VSTIFSYNHQLTLRLSLVFRQLRSGSVQESVLIDSLHHFHALRPQLLHQIENVYLLLLLQSLNHNVQRDEGSCATNASANERLLVFEAVFAMK